MITTDRAGNALPTDLISQQLAQGQVVAWAKAIRIVDMAGLPLTSSAWIHYQVDEHAVLEMGRADQLDDATWQLHLTLDPDQVDASVPIKKHHRIEVDLAAPGLAPNHWPYFTGQIEEIFTGDHLEDDGSIVRTIEVECRGVLQRAKGRWIDRLSLEPAPFAPSNKRLVGLCPTRRMKVSSVIGTGIEKIPFPMSYSVTNDAANKLRIDNNSDFSSPYVRGTDYTVDTATTPPSVDWINAAADNRWFEVPYPERFGVPVNSAVGQFLILPYGREPDDLFHSTISSYNAVGPKIAPTDPGAYKTLLDTTQGEYLTVRSAATGVEETKTISSVDAGTGEMTLSAAFTSITPAVGDQIWVSTTQLYPTWSGTSASNEIVYYKDSGRVTKHKRAAFRTHPDAGLAIPELAYNFLGGTSDSVYAFDGTNGIGVGNLVNENAVNGVESAARTLLGSGGAALFADADISYTNSGAAVKNIYTYDIDFQELLKRFKERALPPNSYIRDTTAGTITIKPYKQAVTADWVLFGATDIEEVEFPDTITRVVVQAKDREENRAPLWYNQGRTSNITNPEYVIDGDTTLKAAQTTPGSPMQVGFRIPIPSPKESYPNIRRLEITGSGMLSVYAVRDPDTPGQTIRSQTLVRIPVGGAQGATVTTETKVIEGADLVALLALTVAHDLIISMDEIDTSGTVAPVLTEVKVIVEDLVAWAASLTDDTTSMPTGWQPADTATFGTVWVQVDTAKRESFRYAPSSHVKRTMVQWNAARASQKHRTHTIELTGISQQDARDFAESYLDEVVRFSAQYKISAPLVPYADIGDTVTVRAPAGKTFTDGKKVKNLFLLAISDDGQWATYTFVDYT